MLISKADYEKRKAATKALIAKGIKVTVEKGLRQGLAPAGEHVEVGKTQLSFTKYLRGGLFGNWKNAADELKISKAYSSIGQQAGGLFVPDVIATELLPRLETEGGYLRRMGCKVVTVGGFRSYKFNVSGTAPSVTWGTEASTVSEGTYSTFNRETLESKRCQAIVYFDIELINNADVDAEGIVRADIIKQMAIEEDIRGLRGLGGTQPLGLLYNPRVLSTDLSGEIDADDIKNAEYQIRAQNATLSGWIGDPATGWKLSKLKDAEGRYIMPQGMNPGVTGTDITSLFNKPFAQTTSVGVGSYPDSNETFLVGGDWKDFVILDGTGLVVDVAREGGDAWTKAQIGLRILKYWGCGPQHPNAFVVIKGITGT